MEVFALDLAVRETGAAQVEQSLAKMRAEAGKTATAASKMGDETTRALQRSRAEAALAAGSMDDLHRQALLVDRGFNDLARARQKAMGALHTEALALNAAFDKQAAATARATAQQMRFTTNATKGTLAMAGMARNMIATGNAASLMSGGIVGAGSQIAAMFGPTGILVGAVGIFVATFTSSMRKVRDEVKVTMDAINADTRRMAQVLGDISRIRSAEDVQQSLDLLRGGTGRGVSGAAATADDLRALGIRGLEFDLRGLQRRSDALKADSESMRNNRQERARALLAYRDLQPVIQRYTAVLNELRTAETALLDRQRQLNAESATRLQQSNAEVRAAAERTAAIERERTAILNRERIRAIGPAGLPRGFENLPKKKPLFTPGQVADATRITELRDNLAAGVAGAITGGIVAGISQAIASGDIGAGFGALASALLAGLGSAMVEFGTASLFTAELMDTIKASLASFLPGGAIGASIAMIAAGAALGGVAQRAFGGMGAARGGAGAGGRYAPFTPSAPPPEATRIVFGPTSAGLAAGLTPVVAPNITVIGPNDPTAQRAIEEILRNANRRGTLR